MAVPRFFRTFLVWIFLFPALPLAAAQPVDTLALRAQADSLSQIALGHYQNMELDTAIDYFLEVARILEIVTGENNQHYANCMNNIGGCYYMMGDLDEAIAYFAKALVIRKDVLGEHHADYAASLNNIGACHWNLGQYDEALNYLTEALEIRREVLGDTHPDYAMTLNNLGLCCWDKGDYGNGIDYLTQALDIRRKILGDNHPDYAASLYNLGGAFYDLGDYERAISYYSEGQAIYIDCYGDQHPYSALGYLDIGNCYAQLDRLNQAIVFFEKALGVYEAIFGENSPDYAKALQNLGLCYADLGDNDKALSYLSKAREIRKEELGEHHPEYAASLQNLGYFYRILEDDEKGIMYASEAMRIYRDALGERHPEYANCLSSIGLSYLRTGDRDSSSTYLRSFYGICSDIVLDAFTYLPQNQRSMYWDNYSFQYSINLPVATHFLSGDKEFMRTAYNGVLFSKGLLLNTETELRRLILESGDEEALSLYDRLLEERQWLDELYKIPVSERPMPVDSLENLCESLEKDLQLKSRDFGDYTKNLTVTWKDVQAALGKHDIAIEFLEIPVAEDTTVYGALTLKQGYDAPHFIELFDLKDLEALRAKYAGRPHSEGLVMEDRSLYDMVWKPLEGELKGTKNVFFGPSGELYHIAIEYAAGGKRPALRKKNIYRLSSTRQLAVERGVAERSRSAVFGGLKYGASEEVLLADSRKYTQRSLPEDVFFHIDSLDIRGAGGGLMVADLPGTETEALEIDALLRKEGLDNTLRMGEEGTEAAFKDLSGRRENIIHIATHGFYWNGHQASRINERLGRSQDDGAGRLQEDASMTRSGLLFTGANNTLRGRENKEGVDDGILTAKEIAQMDLRGTDLLVLSACQTGLGEVSGEGVFGLQRGFKKAGVNTILMSLWEVDDEATSLLMTSFYKALAKGLSKADALKAAQKAVKNYKAKDFSSPYYWAAFILLDGD